jgi:hypothetical protein
VPNAESREQPINGANLDSLAAAVVPKLGGGNVIFSVRYN